MVRDVSTSLDMTVTTDLFPKTAKVLTVSELTRSIRGTLYLSFRAKSRNLGLGTIILQEV
jgi:hypothetical protein